ncbi:MAG: glycosyltransferase family 4 protein [Acidobacteria bacterium]|nr:glycosyltransferase family 4 protein [Acidobacteriota bacterium]
MRIAIDARELLGKPTGVGRYLSGLLDTWRTLPAAGAHEFILCAPAPLDGASATIGHEVRVAHGAGTWWEQTALPRLARQAGADVLFAPAYTAPLFLSVPYVLTIHDVSFAAHPEWFPGREGLRRRVLTRLSARRATRVLTISEFSKREIAHHLGVEAGQISVVYIGIDAPSGVPAPRPAVGSPQLVLYVGSLFSRRHIPELMSGFAALAGRRSDVRLEIVGDNRMTPRIDVQELATATGVASRIGIRSFVSDAELGALYQSAGAFVFLSSYEGAGLTPLEALAAGVPIVVLDTPVAREIYADAALYVSRPEPSLIEQALERVLSDERERQRIMAASRAVLARYSWTTCAAQVLDTLVSASTCRASR